MREFAQRRCDCSIPEVFKARQDGRFEQPGLGFPVHGSETEK